jgi:branched-chain amino acid transport system ATP-binding protein
MMDEPFLGLAPLVMLEICSVIGGLEKRGLTILVAEQNVHVTVDLAHMVYVMELGHITWEGEPGKLAEQELIREAYLGKED